MALTFLKVTISNPSNPKKSRDLEFLIDSGAIYSVVPEKTLAKLGVKPEETREFTLANGQLITRKLGGVRYKYNGHLGFAPVIFGEKDDSIILGVTALESMGMALDPLKRELIPLPMILG
jgi:clan AA aspartic protease